MAAILMTGGGGYIGSHLCLALLEAGHSVVVLDNFANSSPVALQRVKELAGLGQADPNGHKRGLEVDRPAVQLVIVEGDVRHPDDLNQAFRALPIEAVIHLAGLKSVNESVRIPLHYWDVNVAGSLRLLEAMRRNDCHTIVFSSSATIYGFATHIPIPESSAIQPINPYGTTKAAVENMLADLAASEDFWRIASLRYFNPAGAHPSGLIGEDPHGQPNNLFPLIARVAQGHLSHLKVFGADWPTPDGSGVRDYIHVMDLAEGHVAALELLRGELPQLLTLNLGTGRGHSVLELVHAFEAACGRQIPYEMAPRRLGDSAISIADPKEAQRRLGWRAHRSLEEMCRDGWAWQSANPSGYRS